MPWVPPLYRFVGKVFKVLELGSDFVAWGGECERGERRVKKDKDG